MQNPTEDPLKPNRFFIYQAFFGANYGKVSLRMSHLGFRYNFLLLHNFQITNKFRKKYNFPSFYVV